MIMSDSDNTEETKPAKSGRGFASNPQNINRSGRPKGSRNRSKMIAAQLKLDDHAEDMVDILILIAKGDSEALGVKGEIPVTMRRAAAKDVIDKAIANEKEKDAKAKGSKSEEEVPSAPRVMSTAG